MSELLTISKIARILHTDEHTLRRQLTRGIKTGSLDGIALPQGYIPRETVEAILQTEQEKGTSMSELLTVSEVARILRVDTTTVRRWITIGALEAVILPHMNERQSYRIKCETIDALIKSEEKGA